MLTPAYGAFVGLFDQLSEQCEAALRAKSGIMHGSVFLLSFLLVQLPQPSQSSLPATTGNSAAHPFLQEWLLGTNTTLFFPTQPDFKLSRKAEKAEPDSFHQLQALTHC